MKLRRVIAFALCFLLLFEQSGFAQVAGSLQGNFFGGSGSAFPAQERFRPPHLRSLSYNPSTNHFRISLDRGSNKRIKHKALEESLRKSFDYFLIGISLPNESFWVNLRPDSPEDILDKTVERTEVGRIFLEADLNLKKDLARLTSPDTTQGKIYWKRLYKKAEETFGSVSFDIPTLNRAWIVPAKSSSARPGKAPMFIRPPSIS